MTGTLVDTNILVYIADKKDQKHLAAFRWFEQAINEEEPYYVSLQNLREFAHVCLKKTNISNAQIAEWVEQFSKFFNVLEDSKDDILYAVHISKEAQIHFWDANIVATMERNGITRIITENTSDFEKCENLEISNIFQNGTANN